MELLFFSEAAPKGSKGLQKAPCPLAALPIENTVRLPNWFRLVHFGSLWFWSDHSAVHPQPIQFLCPQSICVSSSSASLVSIDSAKVFFPEICPKKPQKAPK